MVGGWRKEKGTRLFSWMLTLRSHLWPLVTVWCERNKRGAECLPNRWRRTSLFDSFGAIVSGDTAVVYLSLQHFTFMDTVQRLRRAPIRHFLVRRFPIRLSPTSTWVLVCAFASLCRVAVLLYGGLPEGRPGMSHVSPLPPSPLPLVWNFRDVI